MRLVEIRDLDGPNLFLLAPAIKVEWAIAAGDLTADAIGALAARLEPFGVVSDNRPAGGAALGETLADAVSGLFRRNGQPEPETIWTDLEEPGHVALAFGWERRRFALSVARLVADVADGAIVDPRTAADRLPALLANDDPADRPLMIRDADRRIPVVAVTGTNGKTTTTRLIAHILRQTGRVVGWSSTTGVYIEGERVLEGDYSGPAGARRVLNEPGIDAAVLETARGGILLRGLATESNDVGVLINISADHLGLQGVLTVEGLARVKAVVVRVTKPGGVVVLNADDPLARGVACGVRTEILWISRDPDNPTVLAHVQDGGRALVARDGRFVAVRGERETPIAAVADIPIAWGGLAEHMVENALCATAACLALGVPPDAIARGLATFGAEPSDNPGRLHIYDITGATVILDYAHNEVGLEHLLRLASGFRGEAGRIVAIIGTAGDRTDEALRSLGRIAASGADRVIVKETRRYLRGRSSPQEMTDLFCAGIAAVGGADYTVVPDEATAFDLALEGVGPGDVVAMMCIEEGPALRERALHLGRERHDVGMPSPPTPLPLRQARGDE
ncbi:MAG TPA: Mur ligase family protein [Thermomicrobiales bacterium]|nr:Mur ligase family protein [Thermomicrobiales bacterium]